MLRIENALSEQNRHTFLYAYIDFPCSYWWSVPVDVKFRSNHLSLRRCFAKKRVFLTCNSSVVGTPPFVGWRSVGYTVLSLVSLYLTYHSFVYPCLGHPQRVITCDRSRMVAFGVSSALRAGRLSTKNLVSFPSVQNLDNAAAPRCFTPLLRTTSR